MVGINQPARLGKEILFQFKCRGNPVARTDHNDRRIKVIKQRSLIVRARSLDRIRARRHPLKR
jgi:hypothetical protein